MCVCVWCKMYDKILQTLAWSQYQYSTLLTRSLDLAMGMKMISLYILLPVQIESSDSAVQRGANHHEATGSKGDVSYAACVLCERDETQAARCVPHFHLKMMKC